MDCEINIGSIRALEEQIREYEKVVIKLKRARNSLLNVSKLPPEVLSKIFHWNVAFKGDFDGLDEGSHNFLFVCHHWFEVASRTPELWSFWGNTLKDWTRWCRRSGTAPLDLVLDSGDCDDNHLDPILYNVLQNCATRDAIRRIHLAAEDSELLSSIIVPLTSNSELRSNGLESFALWNNRGVGMDVSDFFAHYRFPKLQCLDIDNCTLSWDYLPSRTSVLTTLIILHPLLDPTKSQLLSILASNPALQIVVLRGCRVTDDGGDNSSRVQLRQLEELWLEGGLRLVVGLLRQLDHPRNLGSLTLRLYNSEVVDISQIIGPYLQDHLQHRDRPQNGLDLCFSSMDSAKYYMDTIDFSASDGGTDFSAPASAPFVTICILLNGVHRKSVLERAALDLITHIPPDQVVSLRTYCNPVVTEDTWTQFPNLRALSFDTISLPAAFPNPSLIADGKVFPSLEYVLLGSVVMDNGDWSPLIAFLACRASSGNRLDTLAIAGSTRVCQQVAKDVGAMVRELKFYQ